MNALDTNQQLIARAGEDLFNYAIEREDVKWLTGRLSPASKVKPGALEYELQILKIISVGWGISYYLAGMAGRKTELGETFWKAVNNFAGGLSETTGLMIGQDIDYFETLKKRLDQYVKAMQDSPRAREPAAVIGPVFAGLCGQKNDLFAVMAGSKLFANTVTRVRQYLEALKLR
jgi:hypothetical protein